MSDHKKVVPNSRPPSLVARNATNAGARHNCPTSTVQATVNACAAERPILNLGQSMTVKQYTNEAHKTSGA